MLEGMGRNTYILNGLQCRLCSEKKIWELQVKYSTGENITNSFHAIIIYLQELTRRHLMLYVTYAVGKESLDNIVKKKILLHIIYIAFVKIMTIINYDSVVHKNSISNAFSHF
jgi:hypothetical protein